jgi:hypothetical protein
MSDPKSEDNQILMEVQTGKLECGTPTQANDYCRVHKQRCLKPLVLHLDDREVRNK